MYVGICDSQFVKYHVIVESVWFGEYVGVLVFIYLIAQIVYYIDM